MRPDDGLTLKLIHHDIAGHVPDSGRRHQQYLFRFGQIAKLNRVIIGKIPGAPVAYNFADPAVAGYSEIIFADGHFKFGENVVVGLMRFHLVIGHKLARRL